jgi:ribosomal protein L12E/L44/L45/RPP1/RPP2
MKDRATLITLGITGAIVAVMLAVFFLGSGVQEPTISGLKTYSISDKERNHVTQTVAYKQTPAVGGNHHPTWANCEGRIYTSVLQTEKAVHSLEHGAVWVTYKPGTDKKLLDAFAKKVEKKPYIMMSPVAEQADNLMMSAWGNQLTVPSADDKRVDEFISKFAQSTSAPEPGAACSTAGGGASGGSGLNPGETPEEHAKEQQ